MLRNLYVAEMHTPMKNGSHLCEPFMRVSSLCSVVGRAGFEPATNGLKVRCSTS
jgi:hypothetical protein